MADVKLTCPTCVQTIPVVKSTCGQPPLLYLVPTGRPRFYYKCDKCTEISNSVYDTQLDAALAWQRGERSVAK